MTPAELIQLLFRALELTKSDAEKDGFRYGRQSNCEAALRKARKYLNEK